MILHQIEALAAAGVTDIVLAVNYRPEVMEKHLAEVRRGIKYTVLLCRF
jgi:mannose-1-phosphate guanylyltransferase